MLPASMCLPAHMPGWPNVHTGRSYTGSEAVGLNNVELRPCAFQRSNTRIVRADMHAPYHDCVHRQYLYEGRTCTRVRMSYFVQPELPNDNQLAHTP